MAKRKKPGSQENPAGNGDYPVGKGRPPVQTRWKVGQSGNPKGRPKGHRNIRSELLEIASQKIAVRDGDKERRVSLLAANFLAHAIKGAKGDPRSSGLVFNLAEKMKVIPHEESNDVETVSAGRFPCLPQKSDDLLGRRCEGIEHQSGLSRRRASSSSPGRPRCCGPSHSPRLKTTPIASAHVRTFLDVLSRCFVRLG